MLELLISEIGTYQKLEPESTNVFLLTLDFYSNRIHPFYSYGYNKKSIRG